MQITDPVIFNTLGLYAQGAATRFAATAVTRREMGTGFRKWMLRRSDYVVTYVTHSYGSTAQFAEAAARQGKKLYPLLDKVQMSEYNNF